jgi:trimeric autotransporter adhesin
VTVGNTVMSTTGVTVGNTQLTSNGLSFTGGGPTITSKGIDANGTKITNVANGAVASGSTDAVNGGQLYAVQQQISNFSGSISNLQNQISNNQNEARSGIAQAMAASALRYDDRPGKVSAAAGMSVYHSKVGIAAGVGWTSEDAKWRANLAGTYSPNASKPDFGIMGGLSYTFN